MRNYKATDRKAPRFRISKYRYNALNRELFSRFEEAYPNIKIDYTSFVNIIGEINTEIVNIVIENREGLLLPKSTGRIYMGLYPGKMRKKTINENEVVENVHHNFETNNFEGKIMWCYDNVKYKIDNLNYYCFIGHRDFKKRASNGFRNNPELYLRENKFIRKEEFRKLSKRARTQTNSEVSDQPSEVIEQSSECGFETNQ